MGGGKKLGFLEVLITWKSCCCFWSRGMVMGWKLEGRREEEREGGMRIGVRVKMGGRGKYC